jgi:hypothetical protein
MSEPTATTTTTVATVATAATAAAAAAGRKCKHSTWNHVTGKCRKCERIEQQGRVTTVDPKTGKAVRGPHRKAKSEQFWRNLLGYCKDKYDECTLCGDLLGCPHIRAACLSEYTAVVKRNGDVRLKREAVAKDFVSKNSTITVAKQVLVEAEEAKKVADAIGDAMKIAALTMEMRAVEWAIIDIEDVLKQAKPSKYEPCLLLVIDMHRVNGHEKRLALHTETLRSLLA